MALKGLSYLHRIAVIHRDVKPENMMVDDNDTLTFVDLGYTTQIKQNQVDYLGAGTPKYKAPEFKIPRAKRVYDYKVDIYSIGIILRDDLKPKASKESKDLIKQMTEEDPSKRLDAKQCMNHPFFQKSRLESESIQNDIMLEV